MKGYGEGGSELAFFGVNSCTHVQVKLRFSTLLLTLILIFCMQIVAHECKHFIFEGPAAVGKRSMVLALIRDAFGPNDLKVTITSYQLSFTSAFTIIYVLFTMPSHILLCFVNTVISQIREERKKFELKVLSRLSHLLILLSLSLFFVFHQSEQVPHFPIY